MDRPNKRLRLGGATRHLERLHFVPWLENILTQLREGRELDIPAAISQLLQGAQEAPIRAAGSALDLFVDALSKQVIAYKEAVESLSTRIIESHDPTTDAKKGRPARRKLAHLKDHDSDAQTSADSDGDDADYEKWHNHRKRFESLRMPTAQDLDTQLDSVRGNRRGSSLLDPDRLLQSLQSLVGSNAVTLTDNLQEMVMIDEPIDIDEDADIEALTAFLETLKANVRPRALPAEINPPVKEEHNESDDGGWNGPSSPMLTPTDTHTMAETDGPAATQADEGAASTPTCNMMDDASTPRHSLGSRGTTTDGATDICTPPAAASSRSDIKTSKRSQARRKTTEVGPSDLRHIIDPVSLHDEKDIVRWFLRDRTGFLIPQIPAQRTWLPPLGGMFSNVQGLQRCHFARLQQESEMGAHPPDEALSFMYEFWKPLFPRISEPDLLWQIPTSIFSRASSPSLQDMHDHFDSDNYPTPHARPGREGGASPESQASTPPLSPRRQVQPELTEGSAIAPWTEERHSQRNWALQIAGPSRDISMFDFIRLKTRAKETVKFSDLTIGKSKSEVAKTLMQLLVLRSRGLTQLRQEAPYSDFEIEALSDNPLT